MAETLQHSPPSADDAPTPAGTDRPGRIRPALGIAFWLGAAWLVVLVLAAVLAPVLPLQSPLEPDPPMARTGPSAAHWLGADSLGRDLLSRVVFGARASLAVAVVSAAVSGLVGGLLGLVAGYVRGAVETLIMATMDIMLAFPALVLALALTAFLGASLTNVIVAITVLAVPVVARVARAQTLTHAERPFVLAARTIGARDGRILLREVAPNVVPSLAAFALVVAGLAIVIEGGLSYLGLGVPPPSPTWGGTIAAGQSDLDGAAHISLVPAAVLCVTVLALNTVGERLRVLDEEL